MTAACVFFSWLSVESRERREEQEALGRMDYITDGEDVAGWLRRVTHEEDAAGPHWLRRLIGPRFFQVFDRVRALSINNRLEGFGRGSDGAVYGGPKLRNPEELSHLRHLRWLDCGRESAAIVRFLPRPDRLEHLECIASDAGLVEIHRCRNLQSLMLHEAERGKRFSARGMARLEALGKLRSTSTWAQSRSKVPRWNTSRD